MQGPNQERVERDARWFVGVGCVFADDFIKKHIGGDRMKLLSLSGAYVFRMARPVPCIFISFGAGGAWVQDCPVTKQCFVPRSDAESFATGAFMLAIDPDNKFGIRTWCYHVDLAEAQVIHKPTDTEIAQLQMDYRDDKIKRKKPMASSPEERMQRELRALDRRRYNAAGILPPDDRLRDDAANYIEVMRQGPRRGIRPGKKLDGYRSDSSEEEFQAGMGSSIALRASAQIDVDAEEQDAPPQEAYDDELGPQNAIKDIEDEDDVVTGRPIAPPAKKSKSSKGGMSSAAPMSRGSRARFRQTRRPL